MYPRSPRRIRPEEAEGKLPCGMNGKGELMRVGWGKKGGFNKPEGVEGVAEEIITNKGNLSAEEEGDMQEGIKFERSSPNSKDDPSALNHET